MISHKHKFIFIHIPKCAGTSVVNCFLHGEDHLGYDLSKGYHKRLVSNMLDSRKYPQHLTISEIYDTHPNLIENYFSFSFVRNPWDKLISDYFYFGGPKRFSLKDFLLNPPGDDPAHRLSQVSFIIDKHREITVDHIGRFENLQEDFNTICDKIEIPQQKLPQHSQASFITTLYFVYLRIQLEEFYENK